MASILDTSDDDFDEDVPPSHYISDFSFLDVPNISDLIIQDVARSSSGGYDYQFVEEPSDDLKCLICLCVARDPQQHGDGGCGKIFCTSCIVKYKETNDKCPNCRKVITTFKDERSKWMNKV